MMSTTVKMTAALALLITLATTAFVVDPSETVERPPNVVDVTIQGMEFIAPDEIPSGWTTFRLNNASDMIHFAVVERLPEGITEEEQQAEVAPVFQKGMNLLNAGKVDEAMAAFGELPEWFGQIVFKGGPGLISARSSAETTVYLEPGTYLIECYVKTGGIFHSFSPRDGQPAMVREFTVTDESAGTSAPKPTIEMTLSSERGIEVDTDVRPGRHTVAVTFESQTVHEHFLGHDVHLAEIDDDTDLSKLQTWIDWTQPTGLETPSPVTFLGGTHEMPAGETAYFSVELRPGRYAWIAEVPNALEKNMLKTFTVTPHPSAGG